MLFANVHRIATRRGEGLRPELVRLVERSRADAETERVQLWPQTNVSTVAWYSTDAQLPQTGGHVGLSESHS